MFRQLKGRSYRAALLIFSKCLHRGTQRYYVSQPYLRGIATPPPGAITRVPAADIEAALIRALKANLRSALGPAGAENLFDHDMIASSVSRIDIRKHQLVVWLRPSPSDAANADQAVMGLRD